MATKGIELEVSSLLIVPVASLGEPPIYPVPEATMISTVSKVSTSVSTEESTMTFAEDVPFVITTVPVVAVYVTAPLAV